MKQTQRRLLAWGLLMFLTGAMVWAAVRFLDRTQVAARQYVAQNTTVVSEIGQVRDITLYKLRYMNTYGTQQDCFAEYFYFVYGAAGNMYIRVKACGANTSPEFNIQQH